MKKQREHLEINYQPYQYINLDILSLRELNCLRSTILGLSAREIAVELQLSKRTVEEYLTQIKNKLGCLNKRELIQLAFAKGFVKFGSSCKATQNSAIPASSK